MLATSWSELVSRLGYPALVRHGLRHTAFTWMADSGVQLYVLQRVAGHHDPAATARYLYPDHGAVRDAGGAFSAWWDSMGTRSSVQAASRFLVP
ncbi:Phage integrase family protein [Cellulomonas marina]|uniref:Phage integrase family protein n=2 Tax=Cellulomonas marina TaxID=988821 RepID=A0A1I0ZXG2_9CELL|nr:Phage integrase family protein [Cellulomonas marina]